MVTTELETASCSFSLNASLILVSGFRGRFLATGFDLCRLETRFWEELNFHVNGKQPILPFSFLPLSFTPCSR